MALTKFQELLIHKLYEIGAIKFGEFRLKIHDENPEAPLSPIYIDLRILRRFPEAKKIAIDVYLELLKPLKFDLLADVPTAGTPLVSSISDRLDIGMITPRGDSKKHGSGAKIDGFQEEDKGKIAVLIDDLVTHADSKLTPAQTLKDHGLIVKDIVVLVDREQGGKDQLAKNNYTLHSAFTLNQMLDSYLKNNSITKVEYERIQEGIAKIAEFLEKK